MSQAGVKSCTVFIGNIPYDASEDDLRTIFGKVGKVDNLRLVYDKDTKQPKGYAFCDYADAESALSAIRELSDVECSGRKLRIDLADNALRNREPPPRVSLPTPSLPLALPAPADFGGQPRPSLPPAALGPSAAALPSGVASSRPGLPGALKLPPGATPPPQPDTSGQPSPEAVIAAVSAHTEIARTVAAMPTAHLQLCLGTMQRLVIEAPENARAFLQENPQLCYALLHAQLLLGLTLEPKLPPAQDETQELRREASRRPMAPIFGAPGMPFPGPMIGPGNLQSMLQGMGRMLFPGLVGNAGRGTPSPLAAGLQVGGPRAPTMGAIGGAGEMGLAGKGACSGLKRPLVPGLMGTPQRPNTMPRIDM